MTKYSKRDWKSYQEEFRKNVRLVMKSKKLSQAELARRLLKDAKYSSTKEEAIRRKINRIVSSFGAKRRLCLDDVSLIAEAIAVSPHKLVFVSHEDFIEMYLSEYGISSLSEEHKTPTTEEQNNTHLI